MSKGHDRKEDRRAKTLEIVLKVENKFVAFRKRNSIQLKGSGKTSRNSVCDGYVEEEYD